MNTYIKKLILGIVFGFMLVFMLRIIFSSYMEVETMDKDKFELSYKIYNFEMLYYQRDNHDRTLNTSNYLNFGLPILIGLSNVFFFNFLKKYKYGKQ